MSERLRILHDTGEEVLPLPRVVLLGDSRTAEFSRVLQAVSAAVPEEALTQIRDLTALAERYRRGEEADLIVVVQTWSDEFPFRDFLRLSGSGPLSRVLCCYGPWCVSDGRSRQDWPLALRVPLEQIEAALRTELLQFTTSDLAGNPMPWTAGRDEVFRSRQPAIATRSASGSRCVIRVVSPDRKLAEMWVDLLRKAGYPIAAEGAAGGGQLVVWDVDPWNAEMIQRWNENRRRFPNANMVALAGFITPDFLTELLDFGAVAVISKLLPLDALLSQIQALATKPRIP